MVIPGDAGGSPQRQLREGMEVSRRTVVGVFQEESDVEHGLQALVNDGFDREDFSIVTRGSDAGGEIPSQAASDKAAKAGGIGAVAGGISGGVLGGLIGAGLLAVPGAGPLLAAGWLAAAFGGAALGAAAGGLIGNFTSLGVPEDIARHYDELVRSGRYLVLVRAGEGGPEGQARAVLDAAGAIETASYPYQARTEEFPGHVQTGEELSEPGS